MRTPPLPRKLAGRIAEGPVVPEVLRVGDETWVNVNDLRRMVGYRAKRAADNGYINALTWLRAVLKDLARPE